MASGRLYVTGGLPGVVRRALTVNRARLAFASARRVAAEARRGAGVLPSRLLVWAALRTTGLPRMAAMVRRPEPGEARESRTPGRRPPASRSFADTPISRKSTGVPRVGPLLPILTAVLVAD